MNPADDLTARLQHMAERAKQRPRPPAPKPPPQPAPVARLPIWPTEPELHDHLAPDRHRSRCGCENLQAVDDVNFDDH